MKHYAQSLSGVSALNGLSNQAHEYIRNNARTIETALKRAAHLNGLGELPERRQKKTFSMDEVIEMLNPNISVDEIRAWVWYRRSIGIPMHGWEKFYLQESRQKADNLLYTTSQTTVKDNRWKDIATFPKGALLGKRLKGDYEHEYNGVYYILYRDDTGVKFVNKAHVKQTSNVATASTTELVKLVKSGNLFYYDGELLPRAIYLYNNSYELELQLRADKDFISRTYGEKVYDKQYEIMKAARPTQLSIFAPDIKDRPQISAISLFAQEYLVSELSDESGIELQYPCSLQTAFAIWLNSLDTTKFETSVNAYDIIHYYLENHPLKKTMTKEEKENIRANAKNEGERLFAEFLHTALSYKEQQKLDLSWNRQFNAFPTVDFTKVPIGFQMSRKFKGNDLDIRPAQREGVAFMEMVGSGIISYDVGVGKTITAIIEIANGLQNGKCKRPLIIVPNSTYQNWIKEIIGDEDGEGILTGTGITINDWYNLGSRVKFDADHAVKEKSITLVTYEGFKKIGISSDSEEDMLREFMSILSGNSSKKSARDMEQEMEKLAKLIGIGQMNTVIDIDTAGFDYIVFDEAHRCKNVFTYVPEDEATGKKFSRMSGAQSQTGVKAFILNNYIQRKYGRNVLLLTATPFTNSPLEIYSMLAHVAYMQLKKEGYSNLARFCEMFINEETMDVVNAAGNIDQQAVVRSFNNRQILQRLIYSHINYKTGEEAGVKRPIKINIPRINAADENGQIHRLQASKQILSYLEMTPRQKENQEAIVELIQNSMSGGNAANILRGLSFSLNNALSPYLYDSIPYEDYQEMIEESPKIKYACEAIRSVKEWHEKYGDDKTISKECSGQVIYSNRGKELFPMIKEYLINEVGFKLAKNRKEYDEVEILTGSESPDDKQEMMDAFNAGQIKVLIGTATIREGVNLQKRGTCLYNLYPDWNPTDIQQLEGRIWRQGNYYQYVRIVLPLMQDSMDVFVFQKIQDKTSRINDIWFRGGRGNVIDLESLDPEEIKYALMTDINAIAASQIKHEIKQQERTIAIIESSLGHLSDYRYNLQKLNNYRESLYRNNHNYLQNAYDYWTEIDKDNRRCYYIKEGLTEEQIKERFAGNSALIRQIINRIERYDDLFPQKEKQKELDDKALLKLSRTIAVFTGFMASTCDNFADALKRVVKCEQTVLASKGYSRNDDIDAIIAEYKRDLEKARNQMEFIKGDKHFSEVAEEVYYKKQEMAVTGETVDKRVDDFSKFNYLLQYRFNPANQSKQIPTPNEPPKNSPNDDNKEKRIRKAKAKASALKLKAQAIRMREHTYKNVAGFYY